jgi:hypothetical protein
VIAASAQIAAAQAVVQAEISLSPTSGDGDLTIATSAARNGDDDSVNTFETTDMDEALGAGSSSPGARAEFETKEGERFEIVDEMVAVDGDDSLAASPQLIRSTKDAEAPDTIPSVGMQVLMCYIPKPQTISFDDAQVGMEVAVKIQQKGRRYKGTISKKTTEPSSSIEVEWNSREKGGPSAAFSDSNVFGKSRWEDVDGANAQLQDDGWGDLNGLRGEIVGFTRAGHIVVHFSKLINAARVKGAHLALVQTGAAAHNSQLEQATNAQFSASNHMSRITDELNAYQTAETQSSTLHAQVEEAKLHLTMAPEYEFENNEPSLPALAQQYLAWAEGLVGYIREVDAHFEYALDAFERFASLEAEQTKGSDSPAGNVISYQFCFFSSIISVCETKFCNWIRFWTKF